jgi:hypothetical protein
MPKLQNPQEDNASFLASVDLALKKVHFKARQNKKDFESLSRPDYWKGQHARIGKAKSWDILAGWVAWYVCYRFRLSKLPGRA